MSNGGGSSDTENSDKYQGTSDYEFTNPDGTKITHNINHLTSPIKIPNNATVNPQFKPGKGINGTGNDPFQQVEFKWDDNGFKYQARWHTERQSAPEGSGRPWIITRRKPSIPQYPVLDWPL